MKITIANETLQLHPFKAIFWPKYDILFLADLHLGKATHFRKAGMAVPQAVTDANFDSLITLLLEFKPKRLLFLGDLFHSTYNTVWEELGNLIQQFDSTSFELVIGNHDILDKSQYEKFDLVCHQEGLLIPPFILSHHPLKEISEGFYNLAGHLHPGVQLYGTGRQKMRLPCFYFGQQQGILPAFGQFTGLATIVPKKQDRVFVIAGDGVLEVG